VTRWQGSARSGRTVGRPRSAGCRQLSLQQLQRPAERPLRRDRAPSSALAAASASSARRSRDADGDVLDPAAGQAPAAASRTVQGIAARAPRHRRSRRRRRVLDRGRRHPAALAGRKDSRLRRHLRSPRRQRRAERAVVVAVPAWERAIPYLLLSVWAYLAQYPLLVVAYYGTGADLRRCSRYLYSLVIVQAAAAATYLVFPLRYPRAESTANAAGVDPLTARSSRRCIRSTPRQLLAEPARHERPAVHGAGRATENAARVRGRRRRLREHRQHAHVQAALCDRSASRRALRGVRVVGRGAMAAAVAARSREMKRFVNSVHRLPEAKAVHRQANAGCSKCATRVGRPSRQTSRN